MQNNKKLLYSKYVFEGELKRFVKYAWIMKSQEPSPTDFDLLIPDGFPEIVFVLHGAYGKKKVTANTKLTIIDQSCFIGIQSDTVFANRLNNCFLVGLKFYPWQAFHLFKERLIDTGNKNIFLKNFGVEWLSSLDNQLQLVQENDQIVELIRAAFEKQISLPKEYPGLKLAEAFLKTILEEKGLISVGDLAKEHCLSARQLQRKFKKYYGISPKKFISIIRFKELYKSMVLGEKQTDFYDFGYYDQMHFIKDFRKRLGVTPSDTNTKDFIQMNEMAKMNH